MFKPHCLLIFAFLILSLTIAKVYDIQAATISYTYDPLNRLIREEYDNGTTIDYTYDAVGNRVSRVIESPINIVNDELSAETGPGTHSPDPVPEGPAGTLSFTSEFCNIGTKKLTALKSVTTTLTGENVLINRDTGTSPGVGSELTFPANGEYADLKLDPNECVEVPYTIGLAKGAPFDFFVDVMEIASAPDPTSSLVRAEVGTHRRERPPGSINLIRGSD